jgi:hypothetical protein
MKALIAGVLLSVAVAAVAAQQYGVTVTPAKNVDFAKFKSYSWSKTQPARLKSVDEQIVAAIDRELKDLGMAKAASGPGDVLVTYRSLQRTDVDVKAKGDAAGIKPELSVGTLVVDLLEPGTQRQFLRMRLDKPMDAADPAKLESAINTGVAEMFAKYPTRQKK